MLRARGVSRKSAFGYALPTPSFMANRVIESLFVGSAEAAEDEGFLTSNGITHVVNCAGHDIANHYEGFGVKYFSLVWLDLPTAKIFKTGEVEYMVNFIREGMTDGNCVLIHSVHGKSRAVIACATFLSMKFGWPASAALKYVGIKRLCASARAHFVKQMEDFLKRCPPKHGFYDPFAVRTRKPMDMDLEQELHRNTLFNATAGLLPTAPKESVRVLRDSVRGLVGEGTSSRRGPYSVKGKVVWIDKKVSTVSPFSNSGGRRVTYDSRSPVARYSSTLGMVRPPNASYNSMTPGSCLPRHRLYESPDYEHLKGATAYQGRPMSSGGSQRLSLSNQGEGSNSMMVLGAGGRSSNMMNSSSGRKRLVKAILRNSYSYERELAVEAAGSRSAEASNGEGETVSEDLSTVDGETKRAFDENERAVVQALEETSINERWAKPVAASTEGGPRAPGDRRGGGSTKVYLSQSLPLRASAENTAMNAAALNASLKDSSQYQQRAHLQIRTNVGGSGRGGRRKGKGPAHYRPPTPPRKAKHFFSGVVGTQVVPGHGMQGVRRPASAGAERPSITEEAPPRPASVSSNERPSHKEYSGGAQGHGPPRAATILSSLSGSGFNHPGLSSKKTSIVRKGTRKRLSAKQESGLVARLTQPSYYRQRFSVPQLSAGAERLKPSKSSKQAAETKSAKPHPNVNHLSSSLQADYRPGGARGAGGATYHHYPFSQSSTVVDYEGTLGHSFGNSGTLYRNPARQPKG